MKRLLIASLLLTLATVGIVHASVGTSSQQWGLSTDIPVQGDFDGDGVLDLAVFRPASGNWYTIYSSESFSTHVNSYSVLQFGASGDIPSARDVDNDGVDDMVLYRPSNGTWYFATSGNEDGWLVWYHYRVSSEQTTNGSAVAILD